MYRKLGWLLAASMLITGCKTDYKDVSFDASDLDGLTSEGVIRDGGNYQQDVRPGTEEVDKVGYHVLMPEGDGPFPAIILVHGGYLYLDERDLMEEVANEAVNDGYVVMIPSYRLQDSIKAEWFGGLDLPKDYKDQTYKWPTPAVDVGCSIRYLKSRARDYKLISSEQVVEDARIGLIEHSGGGNIALLAALSNASYRDFVEGSDNRIDRIPCEFPESSNTDPMQYSTQVSAVATISAPLDYLHLADQLGANNLIVAGLKKMLLPAESNGDTKMVMTAKGSPFYWINMGQEPDYYECAKNTFAEIFYDAVEVGACNNDGSENESVVADFTAIDEVETLQSNWPAILIMQGGKDTNVDQAAMIPMADQLFYNSAQDAAVIVYRDKAHALAKADGWLAGSTYRHALNFMNNELKAGLPGFVEKSLEDGLIIGGCHEAVQSPSDYIAQELALAQETSQQEEDEEHVPDTDFTKNSCYIFKNR